MLPEITRDDVAWVLALLPECEPSDELTRAIAEALVLRLYASPDQFRQALDVVKRVASARNLPD
jgi:hypothetical protein